MAEYKKVIAVDLDGTLTIDEVHWENYINADPNPIAIHKINQLYKKGNTEIVIYTARPQEDNEVTLRWLRRHKVKFHKVRFGKLRADLYIDNASKRIDDL